MLVSPVLRKDWMAECHKCGPVRTFGTLKVVRPFGGYLLREHALQNVKEEHCDTLLHVTCAQAHAKIICIFRSIYQTVFGFLSFYGCAGHWNEISLGRFGLWSGYFKLALALVLATWKCVLICIGLIERIICGALCMNEPLEKLHLFDDELG